MPDATKQAPFDLELFSFLADLRANNDRRWFAAAPLTHIICDARELPY
jgi:hypothetical protein